ncbi:MAG: CocE/NonD family hydrolase [Myxococcales bacterium]|nr:CocE/NonD family hydrolase [Myxococcales bacterium]
MPGELQEQIDIEVPMRDGLSLRANAFRPSDDGRYPVIMTLGPYPKDIHFADWDRAGFYAGLEEQGPYMHWETVNPQWWVPLGYAVIRIDARGTGKSPGRPSMLSMREANDFYDAIEWAAAQPYCNGKVAVMGISYYAMNAWRVGSLNPPHLAAIVPWEGALDLYRDANRHGGIASNTFTQSWSRNVEQHTQGPQATPSADPERELLDERQRRNHPDLAQMRVPLFSAANWGGAGLHLRGNLEGFAAAGSTHKQLRIHVGNHCAPFYSLEGRLEQLRFLEHFLKGVDTGITREPPIKLAVRRGGERFTWRYEYEWPLARTQWTPYFLDAAHGSLGTEACQEASHASYDAGGAEGADRLRFGTPPFEHETEFTGPVELKLWLSCEAGDADLMVRLIHLDAQGEEISYPAAVPPDVGAAYGWLRVSHRKLDPERSVTGRPYLAHDEIQKTRGDEIVAVRVEIWPTCIVAEKGQRLVLEVAAQDDPRLRPFTHTDARDRIQTGKVTVYSGGDHDSQLLLPQIPARA